MRRRGWEGERRAQIARRLRAASPPRAEEAERRAWRVVRAAHAARPAPRRRGPARRLALAAAAAACLVALALTPAGAQVGDWIGDVVDPAPEATRSSLASLPAQGRLLVEADAGAWVVADDGARRRLGTFRDPSWSPGGLFVVAARRNELVALEPDGDERWSRPASARVTQPRWSPDGYRIAYRSGAELHVAVADNSATALLARRTLPVAPAWQPRRAPAEQVVAYARGRRVTITEVDRPRRVLGRTPPGPAPRELWWNADGTRLVAVSEQQVRVHDARGRVLRTVALPRGLVAGGSALASGGGRLALIAAAPGARSSELLVLRLDRRRPARRLLGGLGRLEGLSWSLDGSLLVVGLPEADQWLFVRPGAAGGLESVKRIRGQFRGGAAPRSGSFPRPAGWCRAKPAASAATGGPVCSTGAEG